MRQLLLITALCLLAAGCSPETQDGALSAGEIDSLSTDTVTVPDEVAILASETGEATFYADTFDRQRTASGELLDQNELVAAHRRFPFGTRVRVTNVRTDQSVDVRIIDRGPFGAPKVAQQKVIDLSRAAASRLGIINEGRAVVQVDVLEYGDGIAHSQ